MSRLVLIFLVAFVAELVSVASAEPSPELSGAVSFNRDIRPILSDACFKCHGPDEGQRQAELRLDVEDGALAARDGHAAIVSGDVEKSELYRRITSSDDDERMPPADSGKSLTDRQIALFKRWIEQGAPWQKHWAFIPPKRPPLPKTKNTTWRKNAVDDFILARLEREGLAPSPEADKATLIRRVTLDLTGFPPTPAEVDAFLADDSAAAYEKVVKRLLASPHYGERMAMRWLDAARYADTAGYQTDGVRHMWRWRDWVIDAYNRNMPFDQFTIEQIAGDLLSAPTLDQRIATGFNRNHRANSEGGIVFEEYLVEYAVDRVDTTFTVWLGLTMGCARCHDHKYDPITQKEFYQVYAYFNRVPERGRVIKYGNSPPLIKAPTPAMQKELSDLDEQLAAAEAAFREQAVELDSAQGGWEGTPEAKSAGDWSITEQLAAHYRFDGDLVDDIASEESAGETTFAGGNAAFAEGRLGRAVDLSGDSRVTGIHIPDFSGDEKVSFGVWIFPEQTQSGIILARMDDDDSRDAGLSMHFAGGKLRVHVGPRWLDDALKIESAATIEPGRWRHVMVTYDGSQMAGGLKLYLDGEPAQMRVLLDYFTGTFTLAQEVRLGSHGRLDDFRYYTSELSPDEVAIAATADTIPEIVSVPRGRRTPGQKKKLNAFYLANHSPESIRATHERLVKLRRTRGAFVESIPTTMVMQDRPDPPATHVLVRGEYDKPGETVACGVPASLAPLPPGAPDNRLGFAEWLVDPANPLVSRVAVNRYWQMMFGTGLVKTQEDFGSQGAWPTHPDLLDWLATEFIDSGWNVKHMHELIVTSATYRQSAAATPEKMARDPGNVLLARAPRMRLPAEMVRDQALAASGLLSDKIGGPSVKPYQPAGLWQEIANDTYVQDHGDRLYRRSMYTFWKRTVPPPTMTTFDATSREACTVNRSRTNTPLQALALLNDVTYVEAARLLAERMMGEASSPDERLTLAFRLVLARPPTSAELAVLLSGFERNRQRFAGDGEAAKKLLSVGERKPNPDLSPAELAAYTTVASLILNLDEAITRE